MPSGYSLSGKLTSSVRSVAGLRVEAWDAEGISSDLIEIARSDARGGFEMKIGADYLDDLIPKKRPALTFRVFESGKEVPLAQRVMWQLVAQSVRLQILLVGGKVPDGQEPSLLVVRGVVRDADGRGLAQRTVRAFDRNLSAEGFSETELGSGARTDAEGWYEIRYTMPPGAKVKPDLVVRVEGSKDRDLKAGRRRKGRNARAMPTVEGEGTERESAVVFVDDAPATARVDLVIGSAIDSGRSEYSMVLESLSGVLERGRLTVRELAPPGLDFAANSARLQLGRVQMAQQAARLEQQTSGAVPAEIFYGLLRMGHEPNLRDLAAVTVPVLRKDLRTAAARRIVSERAGAGVSAALAGLQHLFAEQVLQGRAADGSLGAMSTILASALSSGETQRAFLERWFARTGSVNAFWIALRENADFPRDAVDDLRLTLRLGRLLGPYPPALAELRKLRLAGSVKSLRDLAQWDDREWARWLERIGGPPGGGERPAEERAAEYLAGIRRALRQWFPTEDVRRTLQRARDPLHVRWVPALLAANPRLDPRRALPEDVAWGTIAGRDRGAAQEEWEAFRREVRALPHVPVKTLLAHVAQGGGVNPIRESARKVLEAAVDLDLASEHVERYLARQPQVLDDVEPGLRGVVIDHLKATQRVLRLARKPEAVEPLLADGLDSAFRIARVPRANFVNRYAGLLGGEAAAARVHAESLRTAATAQLTLAVVAQAEVSTKPWAMRAEVEEDSGPRYQFALDALQAGVMGKQSPQSSPPASWPRLFGEQTWCACADCQSVFSPAAYFVDLLHQLDQGFDQKNAADALFARRPDLPHLKLSCTNTNTPLPAIDLVNEVLETFVAARESIPVTVLSYDTGTASAEELRATPQNVCDEVYEKLAKKVYPFTLPFHRPLAVVRAYLEQLGTSYGELLDVFGPRGHGSGASGADPLDLEQRINAETLGLSALEFRLIADEDKSFVDVAHCYGLADDETIGALTEVPRLLKCTGVSYEELLELLRTYFVNPLQANPLYRLWLDLPLDGRIADVRLHSGGASTVGADVWSRLHRFIRLWRASGWSIADLDRVLFSLAEKEKSAGVLNSDTLRRVAQVKRVQEELDRPLVAVLSLWSDLDTWGADSLYVRTFESPTLLKLLDADAKSESEAFALDYVGTKDVGLKPASGRNDLLWKRYSDPNEAPPADALLANHVPAILGALRISESDLACIWDHAHAAGGIDARIPGPLDTPALLDLRSLSALYRYSVLARALGMRCTDLVTWLELTGLDPFTVGHPGAVLDFVERARKLQDSGFSVAALDYLYRHTAGPAQGPTPATGAVLQALLLVWAALRSARQETEVESDPDGALLRARLLLIHPSDVVAAVMDALDPGKPLDGDPDIDSAKRQQVLTDALSTPPVLAPDELATLLAAADASEPGAAEAVEARRLENQALVLERLSMWLRDSLGRAAIVSTLAGTLGLSDALARRLLEDWIPADADGSRRAIHAFLSLAGGGVELETFASGDLSGEAWSASGARLELRVTGVPDSRAIRSARWSGRLLPLATGEHEIVVRSNGVVRLWIDGQPVTLESVGPAQPGGAVTLDQRARFSLSAELLPAIVLEYESAEVAGGIEVLWKLASAAATTAIAPEYLFPSDAPAALDAPQGGPGYAWRRIHKAALLISGFELSEAELEYAQSTDAPFGAFQLGELPMESPSAASLHAHLNRWAQLAEYVAVRRSLPKAETSLVDVLAGRSPSPGSDLAPESLVELYVTHWCSRLCEATGWDPDAVGPLLRASAPNGDPVLSLEQWATLSGAEILARLLVRVDGPIPANGAIAIGRRLAALRRCLELVRRVGVAANRLGIAFGSDESGPSLRRWTAHEPTAEIAREVVQAARARCEDDAQWQEVARTRNDRLRELQRDALVAYLLPRMRIGDRPPRDADELFEHFLIDVQTSAINETSRVKQAISSVQLFIQRCLLGLEEATLQGVVFSTELWPWWNNYRVWEANRKIFLYPENWIEPELRDGKSPFFEDLESELRQSPLDDANVERAVTHYLEKLDQVARLEVCAMHWEYGDDEGGDIDRLHVVARTPDTPSIFFYRSLINGAEWTPWEKIDLDIDIEGETGNIHMLLAAHERRLYLIWAVFSEKPEARQPGATEGNSPPPALTHWEIRLAWSTYRDGRWSPKQVTTDCIVSRRFIGEEDLDLYPDADKDIKQRISDADDAGRSGRGCFEAVQSLALHRSREVTRGVGPVVGLYVGRRLGCCSHL